MINLNEDRLRRAAEELRYLLNRDYPRMGALNFVANHHRLDKTHKMVLLRSVFSDKEVEERRRKTVSFNELEGKTVSLDGYNAIIVLEGMLREQLLIEGDDGYIRDILGVHGKYRISDLTIDVLNVLLEELKEARPKKVIIVFDKPVSKSGELAGITRQLMSEHGIKGESLTASQADKTIIITGDIALTSDSVILKKAKKCFDIAGHVTKKKEYKKILKL